MVAVAPSYVAYSDEARFNYGRYRGLALVGARVGDAPALGRALRELLDASGMEECKWEKVRSARAHFAAAKLLRWAVERAMGGEITVDALTWDTGDERAARAAVPHLANLRRMYAHLLGDLLPPRQPGALWIVHPDEQHALRWELLAHALPHVERIEPRASTGEPLIQLADLFAGLAVYSRSGYAAYGRWLCLPPAERLPSNAQVTSGDAGSFSASDRERCALLDDFYTECKLRGLRVSLRTHQGLRTYGPDHPICFWWHGG
jgi:hypothetical protein